MSMAAADPAQAPPSATPPPAPSAPPAAPPAAAPPLTQTVASPPPAQPDIVDKVDTLSDTQRKYFFSQMTPDQRTRFQQILQQKLAARQSQPPPPPPAQPGLLENLQQKADASVGNGPNSVVPVTAPSDTFKGTFQRLRQGMAQGAESVVVHPIQTAHSSVELPMDIMRATGTSPEFIGQHESDPEVQQQIQAARDRLTAQWQHAKENPVGTVGQLIGGGLITHGISELVGAGVKAGVGAVSNMAGGSADALTGAADLGTGTVKDIRTAGQKAISTQTAAEEANIAAKAKYAQDVEDAKAAAGTANDTRQKQLLRQYVKSQQVADARNAKAQADYESQTEADKLNHANKVSQIQAQNEAAEQAAAEQTAQNSAEAQRKYQENLQESQDTESERGDLARQEIQTRLAVQRRAKAVAAQAKGAIDSQFDAVRSGITDALDSGKVVQPPWETLDNAVDQAKGSLQVPEKYRARVAAMQQPLTGVTDVVDQAKGMLQGSQQKIAIFESILKRADEVGDLESQRRAVMDSRNLPASSYQALSPEHKALVDEAIEKNAELRQAGEVPIPEESGVPTASYDHLSGYSSELGREMFDHPDMDGDIKRALTTVKAHLDAMKQVMADKAGVGEKLRSANKNYSIYRDVFHENTGPSGSGSPVAKSLKAEDATNATEPFLSKDAEIANRARQMLVGSPLRGPGGYFDPGAGYLVDKLRDIRRRVEALPKKPIEVAPYQEPAPVEPRLKPVPPESSIPVRTKPAEVQPAPVIKKDTVQPKEVAPPKIEPGAEPLNIRQLRLDAYQRAADNLKYLNKWQVRGILGVAGGLVSHALGHGTEGSVIGGALTSFAPMALGRLIDTDAFRNWISNPRPRDFELLGKLKGSDKIRVQDDMTGQIVNLAEAERRIKVSPQVQAFVGPENIMKIAKAITRTKGAVSGATGAQRIEAGMKTAAVAAGAAGAAAQSQQREQAGGTK
jgi:hypothetical protein